MYDTLHSVKFLAEHHDFRFVPAAGFDWHSYGDDRGKQPLIKQYTTIASDDPEQLTAWAAQYRGCNWLYLPGDSQAVLDVDPRHGGDILLQELEAKHGPLPRTAKARTGGGGWHYHFKVPTGQSFKRDLCGNAGLTLATGSKLGFIVPPCRHKDGGVYAWELAPWDCAPAPAPDWLLAEATSTAPPKPNQGQAQSEHCHAKAELCPAQRGMAGQPLESATAGPLAFVWGGGGERLADHPGVDKSQGQGRRPKLLELVGRELGYGRPEAELEPEVIAWAGRCNPPLEPGEALRHLRGLCRKHDNRQRPAPDIVSQGENQGTAHAKSQLTADSPTHGELGRESGQTHADSHDSRPAHGESCEPGRESPPADSPTYTHTHGESAKAHGLTLPGLIGEFAEAVAGQVEGSIEPVVVCLLSCVGNAIGPGPFVRVGAERHRANLNAVLVAPSGTNKSEPWAVCGETMRYVDADWHANAVTNGLGSGEGLIERLDDGVAERRCFAVEAEFGSVITKARREGSTLTPTLCNAWDGKPMEVANRGKAKLRSVGHHVSLWGNITDAELAKRLSGSLEAVNGFANRFLWLKQERKRLLPFGGDLRCLELFGAKLKHVIVKAKAIDEVTWADEARPIWEAAYPGLVAAQESMPCLGRARSQALRLSLIFALLDGSAELRPEHVKAGLSVWRWCEASAKQIFGGCPSPDPKPPQGDPLTFVMGGDAKATADVRHDQIEATHGNAKATPKQSCGRGAATVQTPPGQSLGTAGRGKSLAERILARIVARPGIGRTVLLRATHAKADAFAVALAELVASCLAHAVPGKSECWWPGPEPGPGPKAQQQQTHSGKGEPGVSRGGDFGMSRDTAEAGLNARLTPRTTHGELGVYVSRECESVSPPGPCPADAQAQAHAGSRLTPGPGRELEPERERESVGVCVAVTPDTLADADADADGIDMSAWDAESVAFLAELMAMR